MKLLCFFMFLLCSFCQSDRLNKYLLKEDFFVCAIPCDENLRTKLFLNRQYREDKLDCSVDTIRSNYLDKLIDDVLTEMRSGKTLSIQTDKIIIKIYNSIIVCGYDKQCDYFLDKKSQEFKNLSKAYLNKILCKYTCYYGRGLSVVYKELRIGTGGANILNARYYITK